MAKNVQGLNVKIGADTTDFKKGFKELDSSVRDTQSRLRTVNRELKFDPTNTELLAKKQRLVTEAIEKTENELKFLKETQEQYIASGKDIDSKEFIELEQKISIAEKAMENLREQQSGLSAEMQAFSARTKEFGENAEKLGKKFLPVTAGITALGTAAVAAWNELDAGYDIIVTKTGATGEAMDGLAESMDNVFGSLPTTAEDAGIAIGEVNTRFGLTGEALEELSKEFIQFAQINETDLNGAIGSVNKNLEIFGLGADDAGGYLGILTKKAQDTGISVDALMSAIEKNGTIFKEMGLSVEESVNLLAQFESTGVNAEAALAGLKKAQQNATKSGQSLSDVLYGTIDSIKNAGDETEALQIATDLFGKKGAAEMTQAIREGRISVDDLSASLSEFEGVVSATFEGTQDPPDQLKVAINNLKLAGKELGETIMESVAPILDDLSDVCKDVAKWFKSLTKEQKENILKWGALAAAIGPVLIGIGKIAGKVSGAIDGFGKLSKSIKGLTSGTGALSKIFAAMPGGLGLVAGGIGAVAIACTAAGIATDEYVKNLQRQRYESDGVYASYVDLTSAAEDYKAAAEQSHQTAEETVESYEFQAQKADFLAGRLGNLLEKEERSAAEKQILKSTIEQLNEIYPELGLSYDESTDKVTDNTGAVIDNTAKLQENLDKAREVAEQRAYLNAIEQETEALVNAQIAYDDASESVEYFRQKMDEAQAAGDGEAFETYKRGWEDSKIALDGLNDSMSESTASILEMQNRLETGGVDQLGQGMVDNLDQLQAKAKETGIAVPDNITAGIRDKSASVKEAAKFEGVFETLNDLVDDSGKIGGNIPVEMANGLISSAGSLEEATDRMNEILDLSEAMDQMRIAGQDMPPNVAEAIGSTENTLKDKLKALSDWQLTQSKVTADGTRVNTEQGMTDVSSAIEGSDADQKAKEKSDQIQENLKFDPTDPTRNSMNSMGNEIENSDADTKAKNKGDAIQSNLDITGAGAFAENTARTINNALDTIKDQKTIQIDIRSSWAGGSGMGSQTTHADGGIFTRETLLPSINGALHTVGEAGAEAILPLDELWSTMGQMLADAMPDMSTTNQLLRAILAKDNGVYIDGKEVVDRLGNRINRKLGAIKGTDGMK